MQIDQAKDAFLKTIYRSDEGFSGALALYKHPQVRAKGITYEYVLSFLRRLDVHQQFQQSRGRPWTHPIIVDKKNHIWEADLMFWTRDDSEERKYALFIIDDFTKYLRVYILDAKRPESVVSALKDIDPVDYPKKIITDRGGEFGGSFEEFCKENNIEHIINLHAPTCERVIRTIKTRLAKSLHVYSEENWYEEILALKDGYNNSYHRIIKMTPNEAIHPRNHDKLFTLHKLRVASTMRKQKEGLKVGDKVRIGFQRNVFTKGYERRFGDRVHTVQGRRGSKMGLEGGRYVLQKDLRRVDLPLVRLVD